MLIRAQFCLANSTMSSGARFAPRHPRFSPHPSGLPGRDRPELLLLLIIIVAGDSRIVCAQATRWNAQKDELEVAVSLGLATLENMKSCRPGCGLRENFDEKFIELVW